MNSSNPLVYIAGPFNSQVMSMFFGLGYRGTKDILIADLVVFTGGSDINPTLYGHKRVKECGQPDDRRDKAEVDIYHAAKGFNIPMVGICRGAQFLNAMNGGTLYQHVDGHTQPHLAADTRTGRRIPVTSTHHQMMRPTQAAEILTIACPSACADPEVEVAGSLCSVKIMDAIRVRPKKDDFDCEVLWYADTKSLCFQPHPEYGGTAGVETRGYFVELLAEFIEAATETEEKEAAA